MPRTKAKKNVTKITVTVEHDLLQDIDAWVAATKEKNPTLEVGRATLLREATKGFLRKHKG